MAWMTKRKLRDEVVRLTYRVAELEERLCPTEQHDWVLVGSRYSYQTMDNVNRYKCRRCGKEKEDIV